MKSSAGYLEKKVRRTQSAKNINSSQKQQNIRDQFGQKYNNLMERPKTNLMDRPRTNLMDRPSTRQILGSARSGMPPLNFKTIKFLNNEEAIEVIPKEVVFKNIELNQIYEMVVYVQNLSKTPKRIKIIQPMTSKFRVDYDAQPAIAAGLTMKLIVQFETTSIIEDYSDNIQILYETQVEKNGKQISQKNKIDVPIFAQRPQPDLYFENYINLGFVRTMKKKIHPVTFINNGTTVANVKFEINQPKNHITFEPPTLKIEPFQEVTTNMVFNAKDTGVFRYSVEVQVSGVPLTKKIDVNATTVEFNRFITDEFGAKQEAFDFGDVYFGQKKIIKGFLSNNTPRKQNFKIHMRLGAVNPTEDSGKLLTPQEQGIEMTEQIIRCSPLQGVLQPYAKIPLVFTCKSKVSAKNQVQVTKYALTPNNEKDKDMNKEEELEEHFVYTCIVDFDGDDESASLILNAKGIHPMLKFDKSILNFGDCDVNDHREIIFHIENKHKSLPIEIVVPRQPCFKVSPTRLMLEPFMNAPFVTSFIPNNVGKYHKNLEITFIQGQYIIPLKAMGATVTVGTRRPKTRGPECLPNDFFTENKYIDEENKNIYKMRQLLEETHSQTSETHSAAKLNRKQNFLLNPADLNLHKETIEERLQIKQNKDKYINMIREQKNSRLQKERDKILKMRVQAMDTKLQNEGIEIQQSKNDSDDERGPVDLEWEVKMNDVQIEEPVLDLPNAYEPLFVLKPISNYEPIKEEAFKHFHPDPNSQVKKYFDQRPVTHKDTRDIHLELDGESLQKIFAGPKVIEFGEIFVKSRVSKTFTIKNDLRNAILVQLLTTCQELQDTYQKPQIIPSSETGKFEVVLCSQGLDDQFKQSVKYLINKRHEFEFEVTAKICQVKLEVNKSLMKFQFADDNNYMETSEILTIKNNGNSAGQFSFDQDSKMFVVEPKSGEVPSKGSMDIRITYRPTLTSDQGRQREGGGTTRNEEDKLIIRVKDGQDMIIRCIGTVNEPKCILKQTEMNLGEILVSKEEIKFFQIKNTSRIPAIYRVIQERLPDNCTVTPTQGRIPADGTLDLTVKYCNNNPREIIDEILIMIRGGRILKLPFQVHTVIPDVFIREPEFDFGKITILGNSGALTMTLQNNSSIDADLTLDMRGEDEHPDINMVPDGIECLQITVMDEGDESILKSVVFEESDDGKGDQPGDLLDGDDLGDQDESESEEDIQDQNTQKLYNFVVRANSSLKFEIKFSPKDDKQYSFKIPIALQRYGDKIPKLVREVRCKGIKPKFLVDPYVVEFPRKIITNAEKMFPFTTEITLSNPGKTSLVWRLPENCFENEQIFSVHPQEGRVDAGQIFRIKASFNPQQPGQYEKILPLYIDDPEIPANQPCLEIVLKGEAAYPKLVFDRREILMPVTPLDIESKCIFKIYNDGYENLTLDYRVADELNKLNIKLNFPDGKTMGIAKNRIKVEVVFSSPQPLSFTTKLKFIDEAGIEYTIPVSGTTDNSIFTTFPYMQRCRGEFQVECDDRGCIQIIDEDHQAVDNNSDVGSQTTRKGGRYAASVGSGKTFSSKSSQRAGLGYTPIPKDQLDSSKEFIKQWLNGNVLTQNIQSFPENICENGGDELFQLLTFLTGYNKNLMAIQVQLTKNMKRAEKAVLLFQQYDDLIRYLKTEGALLNHIRPQHLLSQSDYQAYIKTLPKEQISYVYQHAIKIPFVRYQYIHNDAWITIFYQILKLYYMSKVNSKIFKVVPGLQGSEKQILPECYLQGSNLHSASEGILIRWVEMNNEIVNGNTKQVKISNFEADFSTAHMITGLIKNYLNPLSEQLKGLYQTMKPLVQNEDDCLYNCTILQQILKEIGLTTSFNPIDLIRQSGRENILFFMQLYNSLPNYIPKGNPIIFQCVLGESVTKTIELQNPTSKAVWYWVKYDGSSDFRPEQEDSIKIEPKATFKFKVTFVSRLYTPVTGRITFTNKKETNVQAAALVFELKSQISGRISIEKWQTKCSLYETKDFTIQVKNTFENAEDGDFTITIVHEKELQAAKPKEDEDNKNKKKGQKKKKKAEEDTITFQEPPFIPSFFCKMQSIRLRRKATYNLTINFVPMVFEAQKCYIIFSDPHVGEFQHEIIGNVELPEEVVDLPKLPIQPPIFVDEQRQYPVSVQFSNANIKNARRVIEGFQLAQKARLTSKAAQNSDKKIFQFPKDQPDFLDFEIELQQPPNNAVLSKKTLHLMNPKAIKRQKEGLNNNKDGSSQNNLPKMNSQQQNMLSVQSPETDLDKSGVTYSNFDTVSIMGSDQDGVGLNQMPLIFHFKNPIRDYKCNIILKNSNLTDVRRFKLNLTSFPRPVKAVMELVAPAKELVVQEIPILNNTDRDWHIKIQLQGSEEKNTNYFYVQHPPKDGEPMGKDIKDFIVRKKTTGNIPLIFYPDWICEAQAKLVLTNHLTNDVFEYELVGTGEEPLAEDHIMINCVARTTTLKTIEFPNPYPDKGVTYQVETDLIGASGAEKMSIGPKKKKGQYKLSVTPVLSGQYTGSITFTEDNGKYIWYTVHLNTESPAANRCLELSTNIRKAVAVDIELNNPYMDPVTFEVLMEGEGLMGDQYFTILPVTSSSYELIFMPLQTGNQRGSIAFVSDRLGEIWYELNLTAEDGGVIRLPQLKCELGKVEQHEVVLENPSSKEQRVNVKISNLSNFEVSPEEIIIPPYDSTYANIKYFPSSLDTNQQSEIVFESQDIGKWTYLCFGIGVPPTKFEPKILSIGLNKDYSTVMHFKNPFKDPIQVKIMLDLEDYEVGDVIKLLKKNAGKVVIQGLQTIQIPFTFTPTEIREYKASIVVCMNDKISWVYPIIGITESLSQGLLKVFKTKCRSTLETEFEVTLPGISSIKRGKDDLFNFELQNYQFKEHQFNKIFDMKFTKNSLQSPDDCLKFKVKFQPLKPFKQTIDLIINRQIGGLWKFKLNLESTPPMEDDIIVISSPLHKTTSVSFRLTNRNRALKNFQARFTPDSDAEFAVAPKTGVLEPLGSDGSKFTISFTPIEYGKTRQAKLIIETEEIYWSYIIKGILPKYLPPVKESNLSQKFQKQLSIDVGTNQIQEVDQEEDSLIRDQKKTKKNFLATNIKKTRDQSQQLHLMNQSKQQQQQTQQQNPNNMTKLSKMNRSHNSPSADRNQSKLSILSKNTVQSRVFTAPGGLRRKQN